MTVSDHCWLCKGQLISIVNVLLSLSLSKKILLAVSENNVLLTIVRTGSLGTVSVQWSAGSLAGSSLVPGSLTPSTGSVILTPDQTSAQFTLTVSPENCCTYTKDLPSFGRLYRV